MREELRKYEHIDHYLEGKLLGEELRRFEEQLGQDPDLAYEVELQKMANQVVVDHALLEVRDKLRNLHERRGASSGNGKWYWVLGGALLVTATVLLWPEKIRPPSASLQAPVIDSQAQQQDAPLPEPQPEAFTENKSVIKKDQLKEDTHEKLGSPIRVESTYQVPTPPAIGKKAVPPVVEKPTNAAIKSIETAKEPCAFDIPKAAVITEPSCLGQQNGRLIIKESLLASQTVFTYAIVGQLPQTDPVFSSLAGGTYLLQITDDQGCTGTLQVFVERVSCEEEATTSFNPGLGEVWEFPIEENATGEVVIFDKTGAVVYQTRVQDGQPQSWDGTGRNRQAPMGLYLFTFKGQDGAIISREVTLLR